MFFSAYHSRGGGPWKEQTNAGSSRWIKLESNAMFSQGLFYNRSQNLPTWLLFVLHLAQLMCPKVLQSIKEKSLFQIFLLPGVMLSHGNVIANVSAVMYQMVKCIHVVVFKMMLIMVITTYSDGVHHSAG